MIASSGRELYHHTWNKEGSTHYYEVDFLISKGGKIDAFDVKSSGAGKHQSIIEFSAKYSKSLNNAYLISQKDLSRKDALLLEPFYLVPFICQSSV